MTAPACPACGHTHAGRNLAYICVGCPCTVRPDLTRGPALASGPATPEKSETEQRDGRRLALRLDELRKRGWT